MKKIVSTVLAGALAVTMLPAAPAVAGDDDWGDWKWKRHSWNGDWDNDWDDSDWDDRRYYRHRYRDRDDFDGGHAAALVFGLAAGAIASGIASSAGHYPGSYERCAAAYRSFNPHTWTYLGYDGYYHRCPY